MSVPVTPASFRTFRRNARHPCSTRRARAALYRDPALRVDANGEQASWIQDPLDVVKSAWRVGHVCRGVEPPTLRITERLAEVGHGVDKAPDLSEERLQFGCCRECDGRRSDRA